MSNVHCPNCKGEDNKPLQMKRASDNNEKIPDAYATRSDGVWGFKVYRCEKCGIEREFEGKIVE